MLPDIRSRAETHCWVGLMMDLLRRPQPVTLLCYNETQLLLAVNALHWCCCVSNKKTELRQEVVVEHLQ